jgi:hypothetical protein
VGLGIPLFKSDKRDQFTPTEERGGEIGEEKKYPGSAGQLTRITKSKLVSESSFGNSIYFSALHLRCTGDAPQTT